MVSRPPPWEGGADSPYPRWGITHQGNRVMASPKGVANRPPHEKFRVAAVIAAIQDTHGLLSLAARRLGCRDDTIRAYAKRHITVAAALREERERMKDIAEGSLFKQVILGEGWAVKYYLSTQAKDRGYVERYEHSGPQGGPIPIEHMLRERLARLADGDIESTAPPALPAGGEGPAQA